MPDQTARDVLRHFETLPIARIDQIAGSGRALILAPHADDESLGCGGLIAELCARGCPPVVVILTDGSRSHPNSRSHPPPLLSAVREQEARDATAILGLPPERLHFLRLADTAAPLKGPAFERAVASLVQLAGAHGCDVIAAPWRHDPHCDHEAAQAMACATGLRVLSYPVWGWTLPDDTKLPDTRVQGWRLDIAAHLPAKRRAIAAHASQHGDLIADDPAGFRLPSGLLAVFDRPYEVFLRDA